MSTGLYAAASGLAAQQARLDVLANDIANVSTTGYKRTRISFRDLVYGVQGGVPIGSGSAVSALGRSLAPGVLLESREPLSVAIEGSGWLQVQAADGKPALTRNGDLRLDADRRIVTSRGERIVPPITVPKDVSANDLAIGVDGTITAAGKPVGRIVVVDVPRPDGLVPAGDGLFRPTDASGTPTLAKGARLRQGYLEGSNVDIADAMVTMIESQRAYELASRAVKMQDQLLEIANGIRR